MASDCDRDIDRLPKLHERQNGNAIKLNVFKFAEVASAVNSFFDGALEDLRIYDFVDFDEEHVDDHFHTFWICKGTKAERLPEKLVAVHNRRDFDLESY